MIAMINVIINKIISVKFFDYSYNYFKLSRRRLTGHRSCTNRFAPRRIHKRKKCQIVAEAGRFGDSNKDGSATSTIFSIAVWQACRTSAGRIDLVRYLLDYGADAKAKTIVGQTALIMASGAKQYG